MSLDERKSHRLAPAFLCRWVKSPYFNTIFMFIVLVDAIVAACRVTNGERPAGRPPLDSLYFAQASINLFFHSFCILFTTPCYILLLQYSIILMVIDYRLLLIIDFRLILVIGY